MPKPHSRPQKADTIPKPDVRVLDFAAHQIRRDLVGAADRLPAGRKGLGRHQWKAKNASKATYTPGIRDLRGIAADASLLAQSGATHADVLRIGLDAVLPALRAVDTVSPLDGFWPLHVAETSAQGAQDAAVTRYMETGRSDDRGAALDATLVHMAALFRLYQRLTLDAMRTEFGERVDPLPATAAAFINAADTPKGA